MKFLLHFSRLFVGNLFIFSGVVKANDPLGFSYKLEEYFIEFGMNWHWLEELLVPLAAALCIVEIVLGAAVLLGYRMRIVSWVLLLMIIFFTILTGASAIFEIVRSCGCFGDAIPLTPWESFYKDLILLALILILFVKSKSIKPFEKPKNDLYYLAVSAFVMVLLSIMLEWNATLYLTVAILGGALIVKYIKPSMAAAVGTALSLVVSTIFSIYAIEHLPYRDFRPYAIGKNIDEQMQLPEGAKPPVYETLLVYKNTETGEQKEFTSEEYTASKLWENPAWEWVSTENNLVEEGDLPKITDFSITKQSGEDLTDLVLSQNKVLWLVAYDLSKTETAHFAELKELIQAAKQSGIQTMVLSSAGSEETVAFEKQHQLGLPYHITDGIVLKTIVRSNPGIVYLEQGTVKGKWHENDIPSLEEL